MLTISSAPHMNSPIKTSIIMRDVIIALIPAIIVAIMFFGVDAVKVLTTSIAACVLCEYSICKYLLKGKNTVTDYSAIITGILLAFNLPSNLPIWMILLASFMAIGVTKMAFGGLGKNVFNPALVGRVFLFISFPVQMTSWPRPKFLNYFSADVQTSATYLVDAQTSATPLGIIKSGLKHGGDISDTLAKLPSHLEMFIGYTGGSLGEVSDLALLIGLAYLLYRQIITWHIPFYYLATVFIITGAMWAITGNGAYDPLTHILSGGIMLGAIFMATDYVTSPMSKNGKIIFAIGCGALSIIIRIFSAYPEGVSFAILIMNAFVPLIDKIYTPRIFGMRR